jgi:hypothetical protein
METNSDVAALITRHRKWWTRSPVQRPLVQIQSGGRAFVLHNVRVSLGVGQLTPDKVRPAEFLGSYRWNDPIDSDGDVFVVNRPTPLDWVESVIGAFVVIGGESVWTQQPDRTLKEVMDLQVAPDNPWLNKLSEFTRTLTDQNVGRMPLHHTLMRGPADMVSAITSHARLCLSIYDDPHRLGALLEKCVPIWEKVYKAQQDSIPSWHGGYVNAYGVWAPGICLLTQEDASVLLSVRHYQEFLLRCDQRIFELADYPVIHVHSGGLHIIDTLLEQDKLAAIQVSMDGTAKPTIPQMIPILAKILACKPLVVRGPCSLQEFQLLVDSLCPAGLLIIPRLEDPVDADRAREWFRKSNGD